MQRVLAACVVVLAGSGAMAAPKKKGPAPKAGPKAPVPDPTPPPPPPEPVGPPKPWQEGVAADVQAKATKLYEEGNDLFAQQAHAPALEKYKEAIALWEHPKIRMNMAVTEIRLDRPLDAADDIEKALKWDKQPFTDSEYEKLVDYQSLLKGRVGYIEAEATVPGAHIFLDGKPWFDSPGKKKVRVVAGEHSISGEKPSYVMSTRKVVVNGGATSTETLKFVPIDSAFVYKYRYGRWIPWTMLAAGVVVGVAGGGALLLGNNGMTQFEADYASQCVNGCEPGLTDPSHRPLASERDSAELKQRAGVAMIGVGGAMAITGIILAIANRPTRVMPNLEVAPTPGGVHASVGWHF